MQTSHLINMQETQGMAGEASSRSPRIDDLSREQVGSSPTKLTSFHRWLRVWKQIVIAEVLRVLEPRRTD